MIVQYSHIRGASLCEGEIVDGVETLDSYDEVEKLEVSRFDIERVTRREPDGMRGLVEWWVLDEYEVDALRYIDHVNEET